MLFAIGWELPQHAVTIIDLSFDALQWVTYLCDRKLFVHGCQIDRKSRARKATHNGCDIDALVSKRRHY